MVFKVVVASLVVFFLASSEVNGHGRLIEPVHRGGAWRVGFRTPINYNDNENFCGGFSIQHYKNKGKCGPCGDDYSKPQPRANENGGTYGRGAIVRRYVAGQEIDLEVQITANHIGHFEFSICKLNSTMELESEECFDANRLVLSDGRLEYPVPQGVVGTFSMKAQLPPQLTCEHCVLRWHYHCGNNWGVCNNGTGMLGCGIQETFRTCSDISIL